MRVEKTLQSTSYKGYDELTLHASEPLRKNIRKLMYKMNHDTVYKENKAGTSFVSEIMSAINIHDKAKFTDLRYWETPIDNPPEFNMPDCKMEFGKNTIIINSCTGEIFPIKMSFFKTCKGIVKDICEYVQCALDNYDNPNIIRKNTFSTKVNIPKYSEEHRETKKKLGYYG